LTVPLCAGPLTLDYVDGGLWALRLGDTEILRRIYPAVRDPDWGTVPPLIRNLSRSTHEHGFTLSYDADHRAEGIDIGWRVTITGQADGTIRFELSGTARTGSRVNRVGLCVLHPASCAGTRCTVLDGAGAERHARFPRWVAPHQPFFNLRSIAHRPIPNGRVTVRLEGDAFEMEDQRNWTDASFKTYSRPLALPYPYDLEAGAMIEQTVAVSVDLRKPPRPASTRDHLVRPLGGHTALPALGLASSLAADPVPTPDASVRERLGSLLRELRLSHLRVDAGEGAPGDLERGVALARAAGLPLEIVARFGADPATHARELRKRLVDLGAAGTVSRWLVLAGQTDTAAAGGRCTPRGILPLVRPLLEELAPGAPWLVGTHAYFAELNRDRPSLAQANGVGFPASPQVHARDERTLFENLEGQGHTTKSARRLSRGGVVAVTPVTLLPLYNPNALRAPGAAREDPPADPRQGTLLAAAWTLGSIRALAYAGATSATYYEAAGSRGVVPDPADRVYPVYHVLASVTELARATVVRTEQLDPPGVISLWLRNGRESRVLLANATDRDQTVTVVGLSSPILRLLDETTLERALRDQAGWLRSRAPCDGSVRLGPWAFAVLSSS
jgi:hypothetical protein